MFPVGYKLLFYILCHRNPVFKALSKMSKCTKGMIKYYEIYFTLQQLKTKTEVHPICHGGKQCKYEGGYAAMLRIYKHQNSFE